MAETNQAVLAKPPTNKRMFVFIVCCCVQLLVWSDEYTFATLTPFWSDHFGFDAMQIAGISSAYLLGYFPLLLVGGILADVLGPKKMLILAVIGCGALSACMLVCKGYSSMYARNLIFGVFFGFSWSPCNKLMSNWLPGHERGARVAVWGTLSVGSQVFMVPLALLIASQISWQFAFILVTILAIPVLILLFVVKDNPAQDSKCSKEEVAYINADRDEEALKNERMSLRSFGAVFKDPFVWFATIAILFGTASNWMGPTWGTMTLMKGFGLSAGATAAMAGPMSIGPFLLSFLVGPVLKNVFKGNIKMLFFVAPIIGIVTYGSIALLPLPAIGVALMIYAFSPVTNAFAWGGSNAYWAAYAKPETWGTLNGFVAFAQVACGYVMVMFSGNFVKEGASVGGYGPVFLYAVVFWFIAIVFNIFVKKRLTTDTWETLKKK